MTACSRPGPAVRGRSAGGFTLTRTRSFILRCAHYAAALAIVIGMAGFLSRGGLSTSTHFEQAVTITWYCAGQAVNEGADPYLVEPLRSCEIRNGSTRKYPWVEPAPLPGYALAGYALLARLPFAAFRTLWFCLLILSTVITAVVLARLIHTSALLTLLCLAAVDGYANLSYGELPPLAIAALVVGAALGQSRRYVAAAWVASLAMVEPHIGLPACIAMFIWWPKTRLSFCVSGTLLAVISLFAVGVAANVEYFRVLLPVHAAAEISAADQYSLTRMLHILGFSDAVALRAGTLSYFAMASLGVAIARRVATAVRCDALVALLPPAMVLLGGPFVHDLQLAAAIPAALLLASSKRIPLTVRFFMLVALVFPWHDWNVSQLHGQLGLLEIGAVAAAGMVVTRGKPMSTRLSAVLLAPFCSIGVASLIAIIPAHQIGPRGVIAPAAIAPSDLSSANWAASVSRDTSYSTPNARDVTAKMPVWLGLAALTITGLSVARMKSGEATREQRSRSK